MKGDIHDPKALIRESYRIEGISAPECRAIFFDWALSLPAGEDTKAHLEVLLVRHAADAPDHAADHAHAQRIGGLFRAIHRR